MTIRIINISDSNYWACQVKCANTGFWLENFSSSDQSVVEKYIETRGDLLRQHYDDLRLVNIVNRHTVTQYGIPNERYTANENTDYNSNDR